MANTYVNNLLHIVFHVKSKGTPIVEGDLDHVQRYIAGIVKAQGGVLIEIGGMPDHVHLLTLTQDSGISRFR